MNDQVKKPFLCPACQRPVGQGIDLRTDERFVYCWNPDCLEVCRDGAQARTFEEAFAELERAYQRWRSQETNAGEVHG